MLLNSDCLNSTPGLCSEIPGYDGHRDMVELGHITILVGTMPQQSLEMDSEFTNTIYVMPSQLGFVLFNDTRSFGAMHDYAFSISKLASHKIRHQDTHKVGCQPGD